MYSSLEVRRSRGTRSASSPPVEIARAFERQLHVSRARYTRRLIEPLLVEIELPESCRIMPRGLQRSRLERSVADSRFASREAGCTVLYAASEFATAFVETVVRDRLAGRRRRVIALWEVTAGVWARVAGRPGEELTLLDLRGDGCAMP